MKCCKDCVAPKRYPGCSDKCPEYLAEWIIHQAEKCEEQRKRTLENGLSEQARRERRVRKSANKIGSKPM